MSTRSSRSVAVDPACGCGTSLADDEPRTTSPKPSRAAVGGTPASPGPRPPRVGWCGVGEHDGSDPEGPPGRAPDVVAGPAAGRALMPGGPGSDVLEPGGWQLTAAANGTTGWQLGGPVSSLPAGRTQGEAGARSRSGPFTVTERDGALAEGPPATERDRWAATVAAPSGVDRWIAMHEARRAAEVLAAPLRPSGWGGIGDRGRLGGDTGRWVTVGHGPWGTMTEDPFSQRDKRAHEILALQESCQQRDIESSIYTFAALVDERSSPRAAICHVNLGFTQEPTIPREDSALVSFGQLRTVLNDRSTRATSVGDTLDELFPLFTAARSHARLPSFESHVQLRSRGAAPGLFFRTDFSSEVVVLAMQLLWTFPFLWQPRQALLDCQMGPPDGDGAGARVAQAVNRCLATLAASRVWVSDTELRKAARAEDVVARVVSGGNSLAFRATGVRGDFLGAYPKKNEILLAPRLDIDCFVADYFFHAAARLLVMAREARDSSSPRGSRGSVPSGFGPAWQSSAGIQAAWFELMADLCGRFAMASVLHVAGVLAHEVLHEGSKGHCTFRRTKLHCCHSRISGGVIAAATALFGLPAGPGRSTRSEDFFSEEDYLYVGWDRPDDGAESDTETLEPFQTARPTRSANSGRTTGFGPFGPPLFGAAVDTMLVGCQDGPLVRQRFSRSSFLARYQAISLQDSFGHVDAGGAFVPGTDSECGDNMVETSVISVPAEVLGLLGGTR